MKKIFFAIAVLICAFIAYSCSNKVTRAPITPAPKPATYLDTIAVAAKKSDFYVRMAFDLADMYLSVKTAANSVSRAQYGDDAKFLASYDFSSTASDGIIRSSAFGGLQFIYYNAAGSSLTYSGIGGNLTNQNKRDLISSQADKANTTIPGDGGARRCDMKFYNTDTPGQLVVSINFNNGALGFLNANGSSIKGSYSGAYNLLQLPYLSVENASGNLENFTVKIDNMNIITGQTQGVGEGHILGANDVFIIQGGHMTINGVDNSVAPSVTYTVELDYVNDEANGTITSSNGFSATIHVDKANTYYQTSSGERTYLLWDFPM